MLLMLRFFLSIFDGFPVPMSWLDIIVELGFYKSLGYGCLAILCGLSTIWSVNLFFEWVKSGGPRRDLPRLWRRIKKRRKNTKSRKVSVLGAAGGIGQPLSLLLKSDAKCRISELALFDLADRGMAGQLALIPTGIKVQGYRGWRQLPAALKSADVVIVAAGIPCMASDDMFNINALIVRDFAMACVKHCPEAHLMIISNPVNSTVPIAYETLKAMGVSSPNVFGVTTLGIVRARTFIGELRSLNPSDVTIKVVGGHSGPTIVPLLSSTNPTVSLSEEEAKAVVKRIQYGDDEDFVVESGTLIRAYAAKEFFDNFTAVLDGVKSAPKPIAFVRTDAYDTGYFASELDLEPSTGKVKAVAPIPSNISPFEQELLNIAMNDLAKDVKKGVDWLKAQNVEELV